MQERHGGPVPRSTARQAPAGKPRALRPVPRATASHHARLCHVPAGRLLRGRLDCGEAVRRRQLWRLDGPEARRVRELHCWQLLLARRYVADVMRRRQRGSRRRHGGMLRLRGWFQGDKGQKACETLVPARPEASARRSVAPTLCEAGRFSGATGNTAAADCAPCPTGSYCVVGSVTPQLCATGTFDDTDSAGLCTPCAAGSYQDSVAMIHPSHCDRLVETVSSMCGTSRLALEITQNGLESAKFSSRGSAPHPA